MGLWPDKSYVLGAFLGSLVEQMRVDGVSCPVMGHEVTCASSVILSVLHHPRLPDRIHDTRDDGGRRA